MHSLSITNTRDGQTCKIKLKTKPAHSSIAMSVCTMQPLANEMEGPQQHRGQLLNTWKGTQISQ